MWPDRGTALIAKLDDEKNASKVRAATRHGHHTIVLLVVEDDPASSRALARLLAPRPQIHVRSASEAKQTLATREDAVGCLIDVDLADGLRAGIGFLEFVRSGFPHLVCGILTGNCEPDVVNAGQRFGAAVIINPALPELMTWVLEKIDTAADASLSAAITERAGSTYALTTREKTIVSWYLAGGDALGYLRNTSISRSTFKTHRQNILRKTGQTSLEALAVGLLRGAIRRSPR